MRSDLLTASRLRVYRDCAKKHDFMYERGFRPVREAETLRFGSLVHKALEIRWRAVQAEGQGSLDEVIALIAARAEDEIERIRAEEIVVAYDDYWIRDFEEYEVLAVEPRFYAPLLNPETMAASRTWRLGGAIDGILRRRDTGRLLVREFKTSSEAIDDSTDLYWERLVLDPQLSIYVIGAETLQYAIDECLYDVVRKPNIRVSEVPVVDEDGVKVVLDRDGARVRTKDGKKWRQTGDAELGYVLQTRPETPEEFRLRLRAAIAENPAKYFQRRPIPRLASQLQDFMFDAWQIGRQIREAELAGRAPRNPEACLRYGQRCAFFECCANGLKPEEHPDLFKVLDNVHPELQEESHGIPAETGTN